MYVPPSEANKTGQPTKPQVTLQALKSVVHLVGHCEAAVLQREANPPWRIHSLRSASQSSSQLVFSVAQFWRQAVVLISGAKATSPMSECAPRPTRVQVAAAGQR